MQQVLSSEFKCAMATHSNIGAWRIPLGSYSPQGDKESDMTATRTHTLRWKQRGIRTKLTHKSQSCQR